MTKWLVTKFVKNPNDIENESVRFSYGLLTSSMGIVLNIALFIVKFLIGIKSASVSVMSDGFNNFTDALSCVVTLFGYKLAAKPADKEHPFGHGRMEYVISFVMTMIIFIVGYEMFRTSILRIVHPKVVTPSILMIILLALSIVVKIWLGVFNHKIGSKLNNLAMLASSKDAQNDVMATSVTLVSMLLSYWCPKIPFDGFAGIGLSVLIFYSGYDIGKEILGKLLGSPVSKECFDAIEKKILSYDEILGVHDLIVHDYGPGVKIGSAHAEVDADMDFRKAHDIVDCAEKAVYDDLHILMTLHLDPIEVDNPVVDQYHKQALQALHAMDERLSMHDFRMVKGDTHINLVFDVLIPFSCSYTNDEIQEGMNRAFQNDVPEVFCLITFDHEFIE